MGKKDKSLLILPVHVVFAILLGRVDFYNRVDSGRRNTNLRSHIDLEPGVGYVCHH